MWKWWWAVMTGLQTIWAALSDLAVSPFIKESQSPIRNSLVWCLLLSMFACYPSAIWLWSKQCSRTRNNLKALNICSQQLDIYGYQGQDPRDKHVNIYRVDEWTFIWCNKCFVDWTADDKVKRNSEEISSYSRVFFPAVTIWDARMQEHLFGRKIEKKKKTHTGTRKMCRIHSQKSELEVNPLLWITLPSLEIIATNQLK